LWTSGSWPLAAIIFVASIMVPGGKLLALTVLLVSVQRRSSWKPLERTKLYRMVELVGRWSMVDIYVVAILTALVEFKSLATITITYKTAEGLEAGKTKIKYKNVDVGEVKQIALSRDASEVVVTAEVVKGATPYLVEDTRFWVVRPRIGAGGVSGLGTLFSGVYIGADIGKSSQARRKFT